MSRWAGDVHGVKINAAGGRHLSLRAVMLDGCYNPKCACDECSILICTCFQSKVAEYHERLIHKGIYS
jgi:hypothetical protein